MKLKHKDNFFWEGFSSKTKNHFFGVSEMVLLKKSNFKFVFLPLFFNVKGSFILLKSYLTFGSLTYSVRNFFYTLHPTYHVYFYKFNSQKLASLALHARTRSIFSFSKNHKDLKNAKKENLQLPSLYSKKNCQNGNLK